MPKLAEEIVNKIIETIKSEQYKNCTEIAENINSLFGINVHRRTVSDINIGKSHFNPTIQYPISKKYARNFLTNCCICGEKAKCSFDGKEYCRRHYMQMYHHGEILTETIYDRNSFIEYDNYYELILKNTFFEEVARTKIDKEDFEKVHKYKWYCHQYDSGKQYCQGTLENGIKIRLHQFVLGIKHNELQGQVIDHINGDSLDNRKANLRIVSQHDNMRNIKPQNTMVGIRVHTNKDGTVRYSARITHNYQTISLGTYNTLEEAQEARRKAKERFHKS